MTLNIRFQDGEIKRVEILEHENAQDVVREVCRWNRWDITAVADYWTESNDE